MVPKDYLTEQEERDYIRFCKQIEQAKTEEAADFYERKVKKLLEKSIFRYQKENEIK